MDNKKVLNDSYSWMTMLYFKAPTDQRSFLKSPQSRKITTTAVTPARMFAPVQCPSVSPVCQRPPPTGGDNCGNSRDRRRQSVLSSMSPFIRPSSSIGPFHGLIQCQLHLRGRCSVCVSAADHLHMGLSLSPSLAPSLSLFPSLCVLSGQSVSLADDVTHSPQCVF